jgi:spore maturation protein CgeB
VNEPLDFVILGLSLTSSWGNGHATTYRALVRELVRRGHRVLFLERDVPWYANNRDLPNPPYGEVGLYESFEELSDRFGGEVRSADVTIVGSYVPEGARIGAWVTANARGKTAFYDIDTPVTLRDVRRGACEYLTPELIPRFDLYLSFTGGPTLNELEGRYGAVRARPLYCGVDPERYHPEERAMRWDLGYLGTYGADRQPALDELLLAPARNWQKGRFIVAGALYPAEMVWPNNVERREHLAPPAHRAFYNSQRFTLNVTRADMARAGWSPSVRLFEAAACATTVISDPWEGLSSFFVPGREILIARSTREALAILREMPERDRLAMGRRARERVLTEHSAERRAEALERYIREIPARESVRQSASARRVSGGAVSEGT